VRGGEKMWAGGYDGDGGRMDECVERDRAYG
jgi:hypothetical protein